MQGTPHCKSPCRCIASWRNRKRSVEVWLTASQGRYLGPWNQEKSCTSTLAVGRSHPLFTFSADWGCLCCLWRKENEGNMKSKWVLYSDREGKGKRRRGEAGGKGTRFVDLGAGRQKQILCTQTPPRPVGYELQSKKHSGRSAGRSVSILKHCIGRSLRYPLLRHSSGFSTCV